MKHAFEANGNSSPRLILSIDEHEHQLLEKLYNSDIDHFFSDKCVVEIFSRLGSESGLKFEFDPSSSYIQAPVFFESHLYNSPCVKFWCYPNYTSKKFPIVDLLVNGSVGFVYGGFMFNNVGPVIEYLQTKGLIDHSNRALQDCVKALGNKVFPNPERFWNE